MRIKKKLGLTKLLWKEKEDLLKVIKQFKIVNCLIKHLATAGKIAYFALFLLLQ